MRCRDGVLLGVLLLAAGCSSAPGGGSAPEGSVGADGSVQTLAKMDGWRVGFAHDAPFAVLELAYDAETAHVMWEDNVDDDLPAREGEPLEPGVYGDLADVDLDEQVLGLYSSGQSGSCPGWVRDIRTDDDGTVAVTTDQDLQGGNGCTDDYNFYRVLVVIDRDDAPARRALGAVQGVVDGNEALQALVGEYPVTP